MGTSSNKSFLSQAFEISKVLQYNSLQRNHQPTNQLITSNIKNEIKTSTAKIDDEFDDEFDVDEDFFNIVDTIDLTANGSKTNAISLSNNSKTPEIDRNSRTSEGDKNSTITKDKRKSNESFYSIAMSQSSNEVNVDIVSIPPKDNKYDELLAERNKLQDEVYSFNGKLILTQENQSRNLKNRDEKIKILQNELNKIKAEDKKTIESLRSELQFKSGDLLVANQKIAHLESIKALMNKSTMEGNTSPRSKRPRLNIIHPTSSSSKFPTDINSVAEERSIKVEIKDACVNTDSVDVDTESMDAVDDSSNVYVHEIIKTEAIIDDNIISNESMLYQNKVATFTSIIPVKERDDRLDLMIIIGSHLPPTKCCMSMNVTEICKYSGPISNKLIEIISENCIPECDETIIVQNPKLSLHINELNHLLRGQIEKLVISLNNRRGGLTNTILSRIVSYNVFDKNDLFINSDYCCTYSSIYPVWQSLRKILFMMSSYPEIVAELFIQSVIPLLMPVINKFSIVFCCELEKEEVNDECTTKTLEMDFVRFLLESFIDLMNYGLTNQIGRICEQLVKCLINLVPLLGSRLDLRIVTVKLFTKLCAYNGIFQYTNIIDEHKNSCLLANIFELLQCNCLHNAQGDKTARLLSHVIDLVISLCEGQFKWQIDCRCTGKLFSFLSCVGHLVEENILRQRSTALSIDCFKKLVMSLSLVMRRHGKEVYTRLSNNDSYRSLLVTGHTIIKAHLPLLAECNELDSAIISNTLSKLIVIEENTD